MSTVTTTLISRRCEEASDQNSGRESCSWKVRRVTLHYVIAGKGVTGSVRCSILWLRHCQGLPSKPQSCTEVNNVTCHIQWSREERGRSTFSMLGYSTYVQ